jgi:DNA adenine methylase
VPHRSPFRYPGGKTWLVPRVREWLRSVRPHPKELAEPFAGGAIVGLSAIFERLVEKLVLVEKDEDVGSVWEVLIYGDASRLGEQILDFKLTEQRVRSILADQPTSTFGRAFATILKNRVQRGGILAPGASLIKNGENGRGLGSRWYPTTLKRRIDDINGVRSDIAFLRADGIEFIRYNAWRSEMAFFIDPPYTVAGRRLYKYSDIDHEELFRVVSSVRGDFLMTYDDCKEVMYLAEKHGFDTQRVRMKNTHHEIMNELLIGRDLGWSRR